MDEADNNAAITENNVVDSSSVISEKSKATVETSTIEIVSSTTPAISLLNGETTNGIYKPERMEVDDTEDDSRISSENGITQSSIDILKNVTVTDKLSKTKDQEEENVENCRITNKDEKKVEDEESLVSTGLEDICSEPNSPMIEAMDTSEAKNTEDEEGECNDDKECTILDSSPIICGSNNDNLITDTENCKENGSKENQSAKVDTVLESENSPDTMKNIDKDHVNEDDVSKENFSKKNGLVNETNKLLNNHQEKIQEISSEEPTSQADSIGVDDVVNVDNASEMNKDTEIDNVNDAESAKPKNAGNEADSVIVAESDDDTESVHTKKTNDEEKMNSEEPMDVSDAKLVCDANKVAIEISLDTNKTDETSLENRIEKPIEVNDELTENQKQDVEQNVCTNEVDMKESKDLKETKGVNETIETEEVKELKETKEVNEKIGENVVNGTATEPEKKIIDKIHIIASDDEEEIEEPSSSTSTSAAVAVAVAVPVPVAVAEEVVSSITDEKMDVDEDVSPKKLKPDKDDECVIEESFVIGSDSETEMDNDVETKRTNLSDPLGAGTGTLMVTSTTSNVESAPLSLVSPVIPATMASISLVSAPSSPTSASTIASSSCATIALPSATISKLIITPAVTPISVTPSITPSITPVAIATSTSTIQNNPIKSNLLVHDNKQQDYDDDDDCVVIEDDDDDIPTPKPLSNIRNFTSMDHSIGDDSQPPAKKQKITNSNSNNSNITQIGQITIKDARSLMPQPLNEASFQQTFANNIKGKEAPGLVIIEAVSKNPQAIKQNSGILNDSIVTTTTSSKPGEINRNVYPVNMRTVIPTSTTASLSPPKLVPVSNSVVGLPMMSNADLLPGLTDDMFVLEAPSFIVPYIYEKPPSDNLREVISKIVPRYELKKELEPTVIDSDTDEKVTTEDTPTSTVTGTIPLLSSASPSSSTTASISTTTSTTTPTAATSAATAAATATTTAAATATAVATSTTETITAEESKGGIKKKSSYTGDESWVESDDSDEEDEDSESETRTKVLIKEAIDDLSAMKDVMKPNVPVVNNMSGDKSDNYFDSPLGKFFLDIGVGLVQEFVQVDLLRLQKKKLRKSQKQSNAVKAELENAIQALGCNLETSRNKNVAFKFEKKRCEFCNFKSESLLSLANHYEAPHQNGVMYRCNFCPYEVRSSHDIIFHMEAMHNIQGRIEKSLSYNQCPLCPFEDNGKSRFARHIPTCVKKYRPEVNLAPPHDWEGPAKIPRIKPRHGLVGTATAYQAMAAQAAAQKAAIAALQLQQQQHARNLAPLTQNNTNAAKVVRRPQTGTNKASASLLRVNQPTTGVNRQTSNTTTTTTNMMLPNNYQISGGQLIQSTNSKKTTSTGQPSISITPLPRQPTTSATIKTQGGSLKPGQNIAGNKASFVICEICDGYIKDLEQLRTHMQWMHKVKIHPKMIYNRPPLNCQKCQFRFFTDQGLERHLLGSHGLVTSSMQEAANKGKDAGRCPVCGRMYQWKLLNHVSRDHHMTLKPAHLSYKCTVCTATFGMYKQFENHVYTAHSTVAKKAMDNKKNPNNSSSSSNSNTGNNSHNTNNNRNLSASNDALLKPLKINDEITIIPQPASKMRNNNTSSLKMESHVID